MTKIDVGQWYLTRHKRHVLIAGRNNIPCKRTFIAGWHVSPGHVEFIAISPNGKYYRGENAPDEPHFYDLMRPLDELEVELLDLNSKREFIESEYEYRSTYHQR